MVGPRDQNVARKVGEVSAIG